MSLTNWFFFIKDDQSRDNVEKNQSLFREVSYLNKFFRHWFSSSMVIQYNCGSFDMKLKNYQYMNKITDLLLFQSFEVVFKFPFSITDAPETQEGWYGNDSRLHFVDVSVPGAWVILGGGYKDKRKKFSLVEVRVHDGRNFNTDPIPITKWNKLSGRILIQSAMFQAKMSPPDTIKIFPGIFTHAEIAMTTAVTVTTELKENLLY